MHFKLKNVLIWSCNLNCMSEKDSKIVERYGKVVDSLSGEKIITDYSFLSKREGEFATELSEILMSTAGGLTSYRFMLFCAEFFMDEGLMDHDMMASIFSPQFHSDVEECLDLLRKMKGLMNFESYRRFVDERAKFLAKHFIGAVRIATMDVGEAGYPIEAAADDVNKTCRRLIKDLTAAGFHFEEE